MDFIYL